MTPREATLRAIREFDENRNPVTFAALLAAIDAEVAAAKANYPRCRDCGKWNKA